MTDYWEINLLLSLMLPVGIGYLLLRLVTQQIIINTTLALALAYGLGLGVLSQWMLFLGIAEIPFSVETIAVPLMLVFLLLALIVWKQLKYQQSSNCIRLLTPDAAHSPLNSGLGGKILCSLASLYIAYIVFFVFWRSLNAPIQGWDALATSSFKAKVFFFDRTIHHLRLPHASYPLHVPFAEAWIALSLGEWNDMIIKIIFPLTFTAYAVFQYYYLKYFTNKKWSLLGLCLLFSSNFFVYHATIAYRDFSMMYYNCTTILLLTLWNEKRNDGLLLLASLFAGFATFVKLEGTAFLSIYLILFLIINFSSKIPSIKKKLIHAIQFILPSFGICLIFHIYKIWNNVLTEGTGISDKTKFDFTWGKLGFIPQIIRAFLEDLFFSGNWGITWFIVLLSLVHFPKKRHSAAVGLIGMGLLLFFGLYFCVALLTVNYIWIAGEMRSTGLSRLFLHFYPLSVLFIILLNYPSLPLKSKI